MPNVHPCLMMYRRHSDRPSVELTVEERRAFAEIAGRLRLELDGLTFDPPLNRWQRARLAVSRAGGATAQWLSRLGRSRLAGPALALLGLISLVLVAQNPTARNEGMAVMAALAITVTGVSVSMSRLSAAWRARSQRRGRGEGGSWLSRSRPRPEDGRSPWT